jgi:kinetochore protein NDC80
MRASTCPPLSQLKFISGAMILRSTRRGSMWTGGPTLAPQFGSQTVKDTRPLREKSYQAKMKHDIFYYLQSLGFEIMKESLSNITGKDYRTIVEFLVNTLDNNYPFFQNARFEDEFVPALKALKYPYAQQIDNKWLAAPATMHSWPPLLGVLHWLVEMCKVRVATLIQHRPSYIAFQLRDQYMSSTHPTLQSPDDVPEEFDDPYDHKALALEYYDRAYTTWLNHIDDLSEPNQYLEDRYSVSSFFWSWNFWTEFVLYGSTKE